MKNEILQTPDAPEKPKKAKSKGRKIYDVVSTVLIAVIFVFVLVAVIVVATQKNAGKDVSVFGYSIYFVATDSMSPTIVPKDIVIVKNSDENTTYEMGDVITFVAPSGALQGNNITHRISEIVTDADGNVVGVKTRGDNPKITSSDAWTLSLNSIKGKYVKTSKLFTFMLSGFAGYFVCIMLPLIIVMLLFVGGAVYDRVKENKIESIQNAKNGSVSEEEKKRLAQEYLAKRSAMTNDDEKVQTNEKTRKDEKEQSDEKAKCNENTHE